jgi:hypothetical protein
VKVLSDNDKPALEYIRQRGYASYSSLKNVRDCVIPTVSNEAYFKFGTELHARFLEGIVTPGALTTEEEELAAVLLANLKNDKMVTALMKGATFEHEFKQPVDGLVLYGFIDILKKKKYSADLKTTRHCKLKDFTDDMDFLQPALYMAISQTPDFYYIGVSKKNYSIMTFNVNSHPARLKDAQQELKRLIKYVTEKLHEGTRGRKKGR